MVKITEPPRPEGSTAAYLIKLYRWLFELARKLNQLSEEAAKNGNK